MTEQICWVILRKENGHYQSMGTLIERFSVKDEALKAAKEHNQKYPQVNVGVFELSYIVKTATQTVVEEIR